MSLKDMAVIIVNVCLYLYFIHQLREKQTLTSRCYIVELLLTAVISSHGK
jgi:hypothetical protein